MMTPSARQIARSADEAATHPTIRKTPAMVRKSSGSQLHPVPPLDHQRWLPPPLESASPPKLQRQPRSAPATVSTVQQTVNTKPHIAPRAALLPCSLKLRNLQHPYAATTSCSISCLHQFHGPPTGSTYTFNLFREPPTCSGFIALRFSTQMTRGHLLRTVWTSRT